MLLTVFNIVLATFSFACAVFCAYHTQKQTDIMAKQLEESRKPNYPENQRLQAIAIALQRIAGSAEYISGEKPLDK